MASGERFYLLELTHRPAVYGDLGNILAQSSSLILAPGWPNGKISCFRHCISLRPIRVQRLCRDRAFDRFDVGVPAVVFVR